MLRILIGLLCLWPLTSQAIVNIEELRGQADKNGLTAQANLFINGASGNTDQTALAFGGRLHWREDIVTKLLIASYDYGESSNIRNTNKTFLHGRYSRQYMPRRAAEAFIQAEQNEFSRLDLRSLIGAGLRLTLHDSEKSSIALGLGLFHAWETLDKRTGLTDDGTETLWRANSYLVVNHQFNAQVRLANTVYFQPVPDDFNDYRLLDEGSLKIKLSDNFDFKIIVDISHDNKPPQTVEKTDISYKTGIEYRF